MKKILVPTDLSDVAEIGLKLAVEIAKRCEASIQLVNFSRHPVGQPFNSTGEVNPVGDQEETVYTLQMLHAVNQKLQQLAFAYSASSGVTIESSIIDDKFRKGLDSILIKEQFDLIVMGTSGEENLKETFTGNHTMQAINLSACPVLSVRDGFSIENFKNIVVAVDVITDNQIADGLLHIRFISDCFDSHVYLVHVRDRARDTNMLLDEYFTRMATIAGIKKFSVMIFDADDVAEAITLFARNVNAGLITVIKNTPDGILKIFSNSVSEKLVKEEGGPVFTLNLHKSE